MVHQPSARTGKTAMDITPRAACTNAVTAQGFQVRAAGDKVDLRTCAPQGGTNINADGARIEKSDFHITLRSVRRVRTSRHPVYCMAP